MTETEYQNWLKDDSAKRTVLLEIHTDPMRRISVLPYTTSPDDETPNIRYDGVVKGGVGYRESLNLHGYPVGSFTSIELHNEDGSLDMWTGDIWKNRQIDIYYGDVSWERSAYKLVVSGVVESCTHQQPHVVITLVDKLTVLEEAVTEELLGGDGQESERLKPITLGECHNVTPRLYSSSDHIYQWHSGPGERVIEARDRGIPVSHTVDGDKVILDIEPDGVITLSVQGDSTGGYTNRVAELIPRLVTEFGPESNRFTSTDLDRDNLDQFNLDHPQPVGLYMDDYTTVVEAITELADTLGAQVVMSRVGKLRLLKVALIPTGQVAVISTQDYEMNSLQVSSQTEVIASIRLGFCRNWTPNQDIAEGIPLEHRDLYAQEWLTARATDPDVAAAYRISTESEQINTLLLRRVDAQAEAERRLALWSVPRTVFRVRGFAQLLELELGQAVTLYGNRFGLEEGKTGQIIGLDPDWVVGRCDVEILV